VARAAPQPEEPMPDDTTEAETAPEPNPAAEEPQDEGCADPVRDRIEQALDEACEEIETFAAEARKTLEGAEGRAREEFQHLRQRVADFLDDSPPASTDDTEPQEEG